MASLNDEPNKGTLLPTALKGGMNGTLLEVRKRQVGRVHIHDRLERSLVRTC